MRVLGLMSGTSHDGVDSAVLELRQDGTVLRGELLDAGCTPYPAELRARLIAVLPPAPASMAEVCALDTLIGQAFADAAAEAVARAGDVDLVVSHGQTVYHWVSGGDVFGTLQLGQPAWIAERLGTPVVSDLRSRDVAAGGQGAPLVSFVDALLLRGRGGRHAALNLGGIANVTIADEPPLAFDTGPANALIDAAVLEATGEPYDADGRLAARGHVDARLLDALLADPYYGRPAPKSTGKEHFHAAYLRGLVRERESRLGRAMELPDLLATLCALTARTVADQVTKYEVDGLVVSGGGTRNPVLMGLLADHLPGIRLIRSEELGVPGDAKEAVAFAVLGWHTAHGWPSSLPSCTGAAGPRILGSITGGPVRLDGGASQAPETIRFGGEA
jgi:anhydro-N-acetylmuramic acid kinase